MGDEEIISATRRWLEVAVIGLKLCPFAQGPYSSNRVRFTVSRRRTGAGVLEDLRVELERLQTTSPAECETTLLIHPWVFADFLEFNDFLPDCEAAVAALGLEGEFQVASFHPGYQFAGTGPADIENHTNRSPFPTLHLLREASITAALEGVCDPDAIYRRNILTLRRLGRAGWDALWEAG